MITFASDFKEGWQSERSRWTRNPVYPYGYRGFESLTFRKRSLSLRHLMKREPYGFPFFRA